MGLAGVTAHARSAFPPGGGAEVREGAEGGPGPGPGRGMGTETLACPGHSAALRYRGSAAVSAQRVPPATITLRERPR